MSLHAIAALQKSEIITGYSGYIKYIQHLIQDKEIFQTGMTGEIERCKYAVEKAAEGKTVAVISSGDSGLYGMAGPVLELIAALYPQNKTGIPVIEVEIVPGISAAFAAAAKLGAPLMHDMAIISLSDRLTNYDIIKKRIRLASEADFVLAIYNPKSKSRADYMAEAVRIILQFRSPETPAGIVKNACRSGEKIIITTLGNIDYSTIDMFTIVIVGNSNTYIQNGKIITPRGYSIK